MLFLLFLLRFSEAAFITSNRRIKYKNTLKKTSTNDLKTSTSNQKLVTSQSQSKLSSSDTLKTISSPRAYKPSEPIPIPYPKEARDLINHKEADWYQYVDDSSSISSCSSENSSLDGHLMFEMSYDPISEEMRKLRQEKRENRRRLKEVLKKKINASKTKEPIKPEPESPKPTLYYTKEEVEDLEDVARKRTARYRNIPNTGSNCSDLDNDSDFGEVSKDTCYSISF